jgi:hypothetical protein
MPAEGPEDPLEALNERLRSAQETADRLVREATEAARQAAAEGPAEPSAGGRRPPPRGYATPESDGARSSAADIQALAALLDLGRTLLPPDLRAQIAELVREILLLVRALIDWYLERVQERSKTPVEVQDIPIS